MSANRNAFVGAIARTALCVAFLAACAWFIAFVIYDSFRAGADPEVYERMRSHAESEQVDRELREMGIEP